MKYVLLTGASGGLGKRLTNYLLEKNYYLILIYNDHGIKIDDRYKNYLTYKCDLTKEENIIKLKKDLDEKNIKIDILINNAALDHVSELEEKTEKTMLDIFKINTLAPFLLIKYFYLDIEKRSGHIINISSDNTIDKYDEVTIEYDVSKAGLNMLTKIFSKKLIKAKVNTICFGWLDTNQNNIPDDIKKFIKFVPFDKAIESIYELMITDKTGMEVLVDE